MTPETFLAHGLLLPELELKKFVFDGRRSWLLHAEKQARLEVCPRCATASQTGYDHRTIEVRDQPVRDKHVRLRVRKRRLWCKPCHLPFTEPLPGVRKGFRTTERFRRGVLWAAENFGSLKAVGRNFGCSSNTLYKSVYEQLELRRRMRTYPWPRTIGIDEHSFRKNKKFGYTEFATILVDYPNKKVFELVDGRQAGVLKHALENIEGRENVRHVIMDLSSTYRSFVRGFFPNARIVADKFHVLRLLGPAINRRRKQISGDRRTNPIGRLLLRNFRDLSWIEKSAVEKFLHQNRELELIYGFKERLHRFYRIRGRNKASRVLIQLTDELAGSPIPELQTLRKTLMNWRNEILAYFDTGLTNGRTEGFNNRAKLVKKMAYGYKSFRNYRLRLLNACSH